MVDGKITQFEDLRVWQQAQDLSVVVYNLSKSFPKDEIYGLTSQIRRAANSISANIAEGFGHRTKPAKINFYHIAYGSLLEVKNFLYLSEKLGFCQNEQITDILQAVTSLQKQLNSLIASLK